MAYQQTLPIDSVLIDEFRILGLLGSGGFANTYLAMDLTLGREVAIKEYFPSELAVRGDNSKVEVRSENHESQFKWALRRFVREAKTLAKFRHTSVVRVHRVFNANETAYIVLEFVRGSNMESWLKQLERAPTQEELDTLLPPLLDALEVVHRAGVLHRDVKPANIYIRAADQSPVLLDFGAARFAAGDKAGTTAAIVSKGYSPHEAYATDSRLQGPWTDIYGLAATLYRALSGSAPPESTSRVLEDSCVPSREIPEVRGEYRPEFLAAIDSALAVMPTDRPQSIEDWRKRLLPDLVPSAPRSIETDADDAPTQQWRPISDLPSGADSNSAKSSKARRKTIHKSAPPIVARSKSQPASTPSAVRQAQWSEGSGPRTDVRLPLGPLSQLSPNHYFWIGVALFTSGSLTLASQWTGTDANGPEAPMVQERAVEPTLTAKAPIKKTDDSGAAREAEAARRRAEEDRRLAEERKRKEDETARKRAEDERRLAEERRRKDDEAQRKRAEEERRLAAEREEKRKAAQAARERAENERRLAEERRQAEAARKREKEERLAAAREEEKRKEAEAARRRAEEERRLAAKREQNRKAAEAARKRAEDERRLAREQEQKRKDAEAARLRAEEERKKKVEVAKLSTPDTSIDAAARASYIIKVQSALRESGCYDGEMTGDLKTTSEALGNFKRQYDAGTPPLELASATPGEFDDWLDWFARLKAFTCENAAPATKPKKKYVKPQKPRTKKQTTKPKKKKAKKKSASKPKKHRKPKSSSSGRSTESLLRGTR